MQIINLNYLKGKLIIKEKKRKKVYFRKLIYPIATNIEINIFKKCKLNIFIKEKIDYSLIWFIKYYYGNDYSDNDVLKDIFNIFSIKNNEILSLIIKNNNGIKIITDLNEIKKIVDGIIVLNEFK